MRNHAAWNYTAPGASGVANADPTQINELPLDVRIRDLVEQAPDGRPWRQELKALAMDIRDALGEEQLQGASRFAAFADRVREIERDTEGFAEAEILGAYLTVLAFCETYALFWNVIGPAELLAD